MVGGPNAVKSSKRKPATSLASLEERAED